VKQPKETDRNGWSFFDHPQLKPSEIATQRCACGNLAFRFKSLWHRRLRFAERRDRHIATVPAARRFWLLAKWEGAQRVGAWATGSRGRGERVASGWSESDQRGEAGQLAGLPFRPLVTVDEEAFIGSDWRSKALMGADCPGLARISGNEWVLAITRF
jgi:hypothetical protein